MFITFAAAASSQQPAHADPMGVIMPGAARFCKPHVLEFKTREEFLSWWSAYGVRLWQNWAAATTRGEPIATTPEV
jgi:hypothetical protein